MQIPLSYILETENLILKIPSAEEIPFVFSATRHKGFNDGMLWEPPQSLEELEAPLKKGRAAWELGRGYAFSIIQKANSNPVGRISIRKTEEGDVYNIGFWTHPEQQSKGIMKEAVSAVIAFGFEKLQAKRIEACYALWNKASEKVLHYNGLKFIRYIEKGFQKKGKWVEENLVAISLEEWKEKEI